MTKFIRIKNRLVGDSEPCLIVAEISANHRQEYDEAVRLVQAAAGAGADAVKFQTYTPDTLTIDSDKKWFFLGGEDTPSDWKRSNLYELYKGAYTPWEWHEPLKELAEKLGVVFFSSAFDDTAVDFLEKLAVPCYKIASYEATHLPLLKKIAQTGKPVIMSVGFASLEEVEEAVKTLKENGAEEIAVLHCVTAYSDNPHPEDMHLANIKDIAGRFGVVSGFSDNNAGIKAPVAAVLAGASIVEKHFILEREKGGPDARFSIEPEEFKKMVALIRRAERGESKKVLKEIYPKGEFEAAKGEVFYGPVSPAEKNFRNLRRSIFTVKDIKKGDVFTAENIRVIRPAFGLPPKFYEEILGKKAVSDIERGTPLSRDMASS